MWVHAVEFHEPCLCKGPEGLNAVDVVTSLGELVTAMVDAKMLFVPQVNQAVVSTPAIGVYDALDVHLSSNDGLQSGLSAIGYDFGVDSASPLQDAKDRRFPRCAPSSPSPYTPCAKVGFINFNLPFEWGLLLAQLSNSMPNQSEVAVNCVAVKTGQGSDFGGIQIKGEVLD